MPWREEEYLIVLQSWQLERAILLPIIKVALEIYVPLPYGVPCAKRMEN